MRIAFVLAEISVRPIGLHKTIYRYADELIARGHEVTVLHPKKSLLSEQRERLDRDVALVVDQTSAVGRRGSPQPSTAPGAWYCSRPEVRRLVLPTLDEKHVAGAYDLTVATNQMTLEWVERYSRRMGCKAYFVLDYESYMLGDHRERTSKRRTLDRDWPLISSSVATRDLIRSETRRAAYLVSRAIDTEIFRLVRPIEDPARHAIGFAARTERTKRSGDAVAALALVREVLGEGLGVWSFGHERIASLPDWVTQHISPADDELCHLYNSSKIFLVSSQWEGYGQPGAEAMACGATLVSTHNGGVEMYANDRQNALLCTSCAPQELAAAMTELLGNDELRQTLAKRGAESIRRRTWDQAARDLECVFLEITRRY